MPFWTPDVWEKFGLVGFSLFVGAFHVTAYMRGWFVPGRYHREIVGALELRLEKSDERDKANDVTIQTQAQTIAEKNAVELTTAHLLESVRELAERKAGA